ncbi:MAG: hypothetical protein ABS882_14300, partial [Lysinibacillus sp.]
MGLDLDGIKRWTNCFTDFLAHVKTLKRVIVIENYTYLDLLSTFGIGGAHPGGLNLTKKIFDSENITSTSNVLDVG